MARPLAEQREKNQLQVTRGEPAPGAKCAPTHAHATGESAGKMTEAAPVPAHEVFTRRVVETIVAAMTEAMVHKSLLYSLTDIFYDMF
ncbi:MAG: hypothetical protein PVSMB6_05070 [Steroidobacteraceae bacterium]